MNTANMLWDISYEDSISLQHQHHLNDSRTLQDTITRDEIMGESPNSKYQDLSMYDIDGPLKMSCENSSDIDDPSKMSCDNSPVALTVRRPSEDSIDSNSRDSGFSVGESNRFASPKSNKFCLSAIDEEGFVDLEALESEENEHMCDKLPGDFSSLIEKPLANNKENSPSGFIRTRPTLRRALSLISDINTGSPVSSSARSCLFKDCDAVDGTPNFKRPDPPSELISPVTTKKIRQDVRPIKRVDAKAIYRRCVSDGDAIISAVQRSASEQDLIGDFSKPFCLPLIEGRHKDLKSISAATLAHLIRGHYRDSVASFKIIDCRYPYEYHGGHIVGAQNIYNRDQVINELLNVEVTKQRDEASHPLFEKRNIVVFHCEFSSERGPNLSRYLRNIDRSQNKDFYPFLLFPEVYLLDGGYKCFFENFADLCDPKGYLPMLHPDHEQNMRHFKSKAKTWNCDNRRFNKKMSNRI